MKKLLILFTLTSLIIFSCKTVDFSDQGTTSSAKSSEKSSASFGEELLLDSLFYQEQQQKEPQIKKIYIEKPVYYPLDESSKESEKKITGKEAAKKSTQEALQIPEKYTGGTMWYDFDEDFTYEIYCQPYRTTDIQLQPGEQVIEMPFLSENKVWEIGAGVSRVENEDTQHFFLKPAYSGLVTSMIIITDMRVYHLLLKSYKDTYMTMVKWEYPSDMPFNLLKKSNGNSSSASSSNSGIKTSSVSTLKVDPRYLSFDYKMKYSTFKKPYWLPYRIFDDGAKTYIIMNETVLHMTTPVLFDKSRSRINYSVSNNMIVIPELIEKVTMKIGKQKVVITKKGYKATREDKELQKATSIEKLIEKQSEEEKKELNKFEKATGLHMPLEKHDTDASDVPVQDITKTAIIETE